MVKEQGEASGRALGSARFSVALSASMPQKRAVVALNSRCPSGDRVEQGTALVDQAGATMTEVVRAIKREPASWATSLRRARSRAPALHRSARRSDRWITRPSTTPRWSSKALLQPAASKPRAHQSVQAVAVFKLA